MRFLAVVLGCALWHGDVVRAKGRGATGLARRVIGIDLGTTNSAMAWVDKNGALTIIRNLEGSNITPSVVDLAEGGGVGESALESLGFSPGSVIFSVKRLMGLSYAELQESNLAGNLPYQVAAGEGGVAIIEVDGQQYLPQEVAARVLAKLKADAESVLGEDISEVVITVPARFDNRQKLATKEAGEIAGLRVLRLVAEPTAAALAHGLGKGGENLVVVFDLGGGTFDVSVLDMGYAGEGEEMSEVLTTEGNPLLGGDDFDNRIVQHLLAKLENKHGVDAVAELRSDQEAMAELKMAAVKAKEALTGGRRANIRIRNLGEQSLTVSETLTRVEFEGLIGDLVAQTIAMTEKALANVEMVAADIDKVLMVGGSTRVPAVSEAVEALFGVDKIIREDNPDEVVALGAAALGGVLEGSIEGVTLLDTTSMDLGIGVLGGRFEAIVAKDTTIPTEAQKTFTTAKNNQTSVTIPVYQGDAELVEHNEKIGEFTLEGIPPAPRGIPQLDVIFEIDANSLLKVTARDKGTGKEKEITVAANAIGEERIAQMRKNLEENSERIEAKLKLLDARDKLNSLLAQAEGVLNQGGTAAKLPLEAKNSLEQAIAAAESAVNSKDVAAIEKVIAGFEAQIHAVTTELYSQGEQG